MLHRRAACDLQKPARSWKLSLLTCMRGRKVLLVCRCRSVITECPSNSEESTSAAVECSSQEVQAVFGVHQPNGHWLLQALCRTSSSAVVHQTSARQTPCRHSRVRTHQLRLAALDDRIISKRQLTLHHFNCINVKLLPLSRVRPTYSPLHCTSDYTGPDLLCSTVFHF